MSSLESSGPGQLLSTSIPNLTDKIVRPDDRQYCAGGAFGDVFRCWYTSSDDFKEVAVKAFRFGFFIDDVEHKSDGGKAARMIRRELGIWRRLNHRNIVPFLGITYGFGRQGNASLVSVWMPHGTLHSFLEARGDRLADAHRLQLLLDIANGLHYLHSFQVVHGDLTSNNVLLDHNCNARLTDFGCASLIGELPEGLTYLKASTVRPAKHNVKSDIYSFGNMALLVLSGKYPWSEVHHDARVMLNLSQGIKPARPLSRPVDDQHWALIERCWLSIPERPLAEDIVSSLQQFLGAYTPPPLLHDLLDIQILPTSVLNGHGNDELHNNVAPIQVGSKQSSMSTMPPSLGRLPAPPPSKPVAPGYSVYSMWPTMASPPMVPFTHPASGWPIPLTMVPPMASSPTSVTSVWPAYPGMLPYPPPIPPPSPVKIPGKLGDLAHTTFRLTDNTDRVDPFAEGPHYGPVLEPFLTKRVGAVIKLNPLLAPSPGTQDDYHRWNMLFPTSNCYRTTESQRHWVKGWNAPATHPRLTHVQIITGAFPWMIHVRAQNPKLGVTCEEVLDTISMCMYCDVAKKEYEHLPLERKRQVFESYLFNRSTDSNVPGKRLGEAMKRLDWLGSTSRFGGLVANEAFVKEHCGDVLPCTFELKCLPSYPLMAKEVREEQRRLENPSRHRSRRRASDRQLSLQSLTASMAPDDNDQSRTEDVTS